MTKQEIEEMREEQGELFESLTSILIDDEVKTLNLLLEMERELALSENQ